MIRAISCAALGMVALTGCGDGRNYNASVYEQVATDAPAASTAVNAAPSPAVRNAPNTPAARATATQAAAARTVDAPVGASPNAPSDVSISAPVEASDADATAEMSANDPTKRAPQDPATEAALLEEAVRELNLPTPAEVKIVAGDEPYKKLALDGKFKQFRSMSARYVQISKELLPYGRKLADGTATDQDRANHFRLERAADKAFRPLNRYMWDDRWSEADRAAMGWILYGWQSEQK